MSGILGLVLVVLAGSSEGDPPWQTVSIPEVCTFQIPPTMELQQGTYRRVNEALQKELFEITTAPDTVVAQPKGINSLERAALKRYARVIVETTRGEKGEYQQLDAPLELTESELLEVDAQLRNSIEEEIADAASNGIKSTVSSWHAPRVTRVNGVDALLLAYVRSIEGKSSVSVRTYIIQNNDCMHHITISYRETEKEIWADDLAKVIDTFKLERR